MAAPARLITPGLVGVIAGGILISLAVFWIFRANAVRDRQAALEAAAQSRALAVQEALEAVVGQVRGAAVYLGTNLTLERGDYGAFRPEFRRYAAELVPTTGLVALAVVPRVSVDERDDFLRRAQPTDGSVMELTEVGPGRALAPAAGRSVHFPIAIVAPIPPQPLRGVDLAGDATLLARLEGALRNDGALIESIEHVLPESGVPGGTAILVPVRAPEGSAARRQGFALGLVDLNALLERALSVLPAAALDVRLVEQRSGAVVRSPAGAAPDPDAEASSDATWTRAVPIDVERHRWEVVTHATPQFRRTENPVIPWIALGGGLLLTALLAGYLVSGRRRESALATLAQERRDVAEQLKAIFATSLDAIVSADDHGVISEWNPSAHRMFGWTAEEVMGRTLAETVIPQEDRAGHQHALQRLRETGRSPLIGPAFEYVMVRRDGSRLPVELVMTPTPTGGRHRITAFIRDISHRKEAEAAMRRAHDELEDRVAARTAELAQASGRVIEGEQRLRVMMDNAGDAVFLMDEAGRLIDANRRACTMLGYERDELLALTLADIETRADPARPIGPRLAALPVGEVMTSQGVERRKDGTTFPVEVRVGPIESRGERLYQSLVRDVTERRAMEEAVAEARDRAVEASRLKSDFLANMSHEIRTPLNGILGMTGLLLDSELAPSQREDLETVQHSAQHLLALINDILDLARIEAGRFHLDSSPFELEEVLHGVAALLSAAAEQKGIEFILRIAPDAPRIVVGDAPRLRQVLLNLAGNAVKFTDRGHVLLEAECQSSGEGCANLRFAVADTGIGISSQDLDQVFEKFTQADTSTKRRHGGAGLGLAISRQIVDAMGGAIGAKSTPGRGSVFSFSLTLPVAHDERRRALPRELAGVRTLIVDDNPVNRRVLTEQLASWRVRATATASPEEALIELAATAGGSDPYRIALLDYQMDEMDGLELARAIRARDDLGPRPVVLLLSSVGRHFDAPTVHDAGIARWLTKPVSPSELLDALTDVWDSDRPDTQPAAQPELRAPTGERRVLLAEDSAVNRKVAVRMLDKLGCSVDVAVNGLEAVDMAARGSYDIVFMDCQMPEMDGYEATRRIRIREGSGRRTPIVALTAHAMAGDRERCLAAGMDDYLSKPVPREDLEVMLRRWADGRDRGGVSSDEARGPGGPGPEAPSTRCVDGPALLKALDGDGALIAELARLFRDQSVEQMAQLRAALEAGDAPEVRRVGHALKGGLATLYARGAAELAHRVESAGKEGNLELAVSVLSELERLIELVPDEMIALTRGTSGDEA